MLVGSDGGGVLDAAGAAGARELLLDFKVLIKLLLTGVVTGKQL